MRKIIALLLIAVMALSLAACGGNSGGKESGNKDNSSQAQTGESSGASDPGTDSSTPGGDSYDLSTVEGFLAQYSYTVDDFKFTKDFSKVEHVSRAVRSDNSYEITEVGVFQTERKSTEEKQAWLEAFVNLVKTKADDGKVYDYDILNGVSSEEYVAQYNPDDFIYITYMAYTFNGKTVIATVNYHNGLDNEDPDEADYLVGIEFEFMKTY